MNDKKTAIRALQKHKEGIDAIRTDNDGYLWTSLATDLVKKYIGKGNQLYNSTFNFSFNANHLNENAKLRASKLMDSCITFIETNGIYKEPNSNFITRLSEGWAIALFTFVVGTIWSMGFFVGDYSAKNRIDQDKVELSDEVKRLKIENSVLLRRLAVKPAQKNTEPKKNQVRK